MQKLPADKGKRHQVNFRVTAEVRTKIAAAASRSGRSIAQELEARFEASLRNDDLQVVIQKAVADGIAAHEAAKAEKMRAGWTFTPQGVVGVNPSICGYINPQNS